MLKLAGGNTLLCCGVLALFIYALVREDWLIYQYDPARLYDPDYLPRGPVETAGKVVTTFSIFKACMDVSWDSVSSWSPSGFYRSKHRPDICYDVITYNDNYLEFERNRFSILSNKNQTHDITPSTTTPKHTTSPGRDYYRTGYVKTVLPSTTTIVAPISNTLADINCPLPPNVNGGTYKIDTPYRYDTISFSRATYSCDNGDYALIGARDYTLQSFCVNGSWTKPPTCTPKDRCLEGTNWDVCRNGEAWDPVSIVNALGGHLPINTAKLSGYGVFIFPEFVFECDGVIRQWDIYSNLTGITYLSVWKQVGRRYYFIGKNAVQSDGTGLQGRVIAPANRIFVRKGYVIGMTYDTLADHNGTIIPIYRADDLDQANPQLDWRTLHYSIKSLMANVTQAYVDQYGYIDERDPSLLFEQIEGDAPVLPIIAAYVTGSVMSPIRYKVVQALVVLAAVGEFATIVGLFLFIILFAQKKEEYMGTALQGAIFSNLFACASAINGAVLLINEYDCNSIAPSYGIGIYVCFGGVGLSAVAILVLCITDRRLLTELSKKQYTIIVKPPSAMA